MNEEEQPGAVTARCNSCQETSLTSLCEVEAHERHSFNGNPFVILMAVINGAANNIKHGSRYPQVSDISSNFAGWLRASFLFSSTKMKENRIKRDIRKSK